MKRTAIVIFLAAARCSGCGSVKIHYKTPTGAEMDYERKHMNQEITGFEMQETEKGLKVKFEGQKSDNQALADTIQKAIDKIPSP